MPLLPYAVQCEELAKIIKLEPHSLSPASPPPLTSSTNGTCVVCGSPANSCMGCETAAYCSIEHQGQDWKWHARVCSQLREIAEERAVLAAVPASDLCARFVRREPHGNLPEDWASYLGSRFDPGSPEQRVFTSLASRPLTLAHCLDRLQLRIATDHLHIHVIGASRPELEVTSVLYEELVSFFPGFSFEILLAGPELPEEPVTWLPNSERLRFRLLRGLYRRELWEREGVPDLVVGFHPGLLIYRSWAATMPGLIRAAPPLLLTSYRRFEQEAEIRLLDRLGAERVVVAESNPFVSLSARGSHTIVNDVTWDNSFVMTVL